MNCMKKQTTGQAEAPRKGIAVRIDITKDELWALRSYAAVQESTVPKLLADEIRKLLKRK
jgi:hypothetical protein